MSLRRLLYIAAHGGFASERVALGGGAAIADLLTAEWKRTRPFELELVTPSILGPHGPSGGDLVQYSERSYARFCREFRAAATARALQEDPQETVLLVNDISEAPDFARLAARGFRLHTLYHVDVVAYIASIYLHGVLRPETLARWWETLRRRPWRAAIPSMLDLIFENQRASLEYSRSVIVPSSAMRSILERVYPALAPGRVIVHPWGAPPHEVSAAEADQAAAALRAEFGVPAEARILLTLSRISPEKGQDRLLRALRDRERSGACPAPPIWLFICGGAAYMQGRRHLEKLRALARELTRTRVVFPGHVTGLRKAGFFRLADVYVFPSRHESYGLTLAEALSWGCRVVALPSAGAREVLGSHPGLLAEERSEAELLRRLPAMLDEALRGTPAPLEIPSFTRQAALLAAHLAGAPDPA